MNKIVKICMIAAVVLSFTGCYNDFDDPAPAKKTRLRPFD